MNAIEGCQTYVIHPQNVGTAAFQILSKNQNLPGEFWVLNSTSKGVFLRSIESDVIFISYEKYGNPLSILLGNKKYRFPMLQEGEKVFVHQNYLEFHSICLGLAFKHITVWHPNPVENGPLSLVERRRLAGEMFSHIVHLKGKVGLAYLAAVLLSEKSIASDHISPLTHAVCNAKKYLFLGNVPKLVATLEPFIGHGRGLTPSGDDFIIGMLLALNRWPGLAPLSTTKRQRLNQSLVARFRTRTTNLSTQLAISATNGLADERLVSALDSLISGVPNSLESASILSGWGASSGLDTLLGMFLVALAYQEE